jgi:hypothetical protein
MQRKRISEALLVEMQISTATMETTMENLSSGNRTII